MTLNYNVGFTVYGIIPCMASNLPLHVTVSVALGKDSHL